VKTLSIGTPKDVLFTLPPAVARQLFEATIALSNQQKKAGKILELYFIPGWNRVVAIRESKSAEELNQNIDELPLSSFMNYEVYPLADYNESAKTILEGLKAAEKMMPGPTK
jgi:muconolactone delta-isomerase